MRPYCTIPHRMICQGVLKGPIGPSPRHRSFIFRCNFSKLAAHRETRSVAEKFEFGPVRNVPFGGTCHFSQNVFSYT